MGTSDWKKPVFEFLFSIAFGFQCCQPKIHNPRLSETAAVPPSPLLPYHPFHPQTTTIPGLLGFQKSPNPASWLFSRMLRDSHNNSSMDSLVSRVTCKPLLQWAHQQQCVVACSSSSAPAVVASSQGPQHAIVPFPSYSRYHVLSSPDQFCTSVLTSFLCRPHLTSCQ